MIWARNNVNWVKPNLKIKAVNLFQILPPFPVIFLFQWLSWTLPKYGGMILLKFQGKQGSFDVPFDISCHQRNSWDVSKIVWSLSLVLNLVINSRPQNSWYTLKWWCTQGFDTWIGYNWNWRIRWRREHEMNSVWAIFETTVKYSEALNTI